MEGFTTAGEGCQPRFVPQDGKGVRGECFYDQFGNRSQLAKFDCSRPGPLCPPPRPAADSF